MPYALQLAYGWTRLGFYSNILAVIVLVPAIIFATTHWGPNGAAGVWIFLNGSYLLISVQLMHHRLLKTEKWKWYRDDIGKPILVVLLVSGIGRAVITDVTQGYLALTSVIVVLLLTTVAAISSSDFIRSSLLSKFTQARQDRT
jgi:O-antigen/teichoic acid export membrane protein